MVGQAHPVINTRRRIAYGLDQRTRLALAERQETAAFQIKFGLQKAFACGFHTARNFINPVELEQLSLTSHSCLARLALKMVIFSAAGEGFVDAPC